MIRRIAFASCLLAAPFLVHGQTAGACTSATLSGTYSLTLTGRAVNSTLVVGKVYQAVGELTFDGTSAVTGNVVAFTSAAPGGVATNMGGTYTIPSNCVGTLNITTGDTASYVLIPYNSGNDYVITGQDATYELTGSGGPQPATCLNSTLSGNYVFSGNGFSLAAGAITGANDISGLLTFDGGFKVTGSWSIATNGASTPDTGTGGYVMPACIGSATLTDPSGVGYNLWFVLTTADGANMAMIGATATEMFTSTAHSTMTNPGLAVANAAGASGGTPPGSLFSIYGTNLSTSTAQPTSSTYPDTLGGASVTVNGEPAPLSYASPTQINAEMPLDITGGVATVVVKVGTASSNAVAATVPATAVPGIFVSPSNRAIAQNYPSYIQNSPSTPAPAGSVIIVYFTGGGPVEGGSVLMTGHAAPNQAFDVTETPSATINGIAATVDYAGLTPGFIGLYQANIVVPKVAAGDQKLIIKIGGTASPAALVSIG